jgi:hypothetical protein
VWHATGWLLVRRTRRQWHHNQDGRYRAGQSKFRRWRAELPRSHALLRFRLAGRLGKWYWRCWPYRCWRLRIAHHDIWTQRPRHPSGKRSATTHYDVQLLCGLASWPTQSRKAKQRQLPICPQRRRSRIARINRPPLSTQRTPCLTGLYPPLPAPNHHAFPRHQTQPRPLACHPLHAPALPRLCSRVHHQPRRSPNASLPS